MNKQDFGLRLRSIEGDHVFIGPESMFYQFSVNAAPKLLGRCLQ
jgi:hypothetical protein